MKDMESRETFSRYIYNLHEVINKMLRKKSGLTYEDVRERYEHFRARCAKSKTQKKRRGKEREKGQGGKTMKKGMRKRGEKEKGCTEPLDDGEKAKCVLKIIPAKEKCPTMQIDSQCYKKPKDF